MDAIDRIFELVDQKYKDQKDFADALGVIPAQVSKWRNRKSSSYRKYLPEIAVLLDTSTEYLLTGEGPKKRQSTAGESGGLSENEKLFRSLPPDLQEEALRYMRYLAAQTGSAGESED